MTAGIAPGEVLDGKYRVERVLGSGGMGVVVVATHLALHERVAIKFLKDEAAAIPAVVARFAREARAMIRIKSEHVARVLDVGQTPAGAPFMVMEYLEGRDLATLIDELGKVPVTDAVDIVLQAGEAIAEAHALGIIHRDLKPANLFLTSRADGTPSVKVLDFGISKVGPLDRSQGELSLTRTAMPLGSPLYMAPEQIASARDVDGRADIWSMGAMLYELLTGQAPFDADNISHLQYKILQETPRRLQELDPGLPQGLDEVLQRCLRKNPDDRYENIAELARELALFGGSQAVTSARRIAAITTRAASGPSEVSAMPSSLLLGQRGTLALGQSGPKAPSRAATPARSGGQVQPSSQPPASAGDDNHRETVSAWGAPTRGRRRSRLILFAAAPILLAVAAVAWIALRSPATASHTTGAQSAPAEAPAAQPGPVVPVAMAPVEAASIALPLVVESATPPSVPAASTAGPRAPPRASSPPRPASATAPDLFNTRK